MQRHRIFGDRRAFVSVYMVFATLVMLPMMGLAIDFTILYNVKARLQQACDAAVIGAGNEVQRSTDVNDPTQNANLKSAVLRFFNANFSPAPWRASQLSYSSSVSQDPNTKMRTIYVTATYGVPMMFMRVLRIANSQVGAQAIANIRFVNLMIVVDRSGSVARTGSGSQTNQQIIEGDLKQFVGTAGTSIFVDGRDVVGLLTFGGNYKLDFAPTVSFQTSSPNINTAINNIGFDNNSTNTGEGLFQAWYQLKQLNQSGALNVILLITDGRPSAFTATFLSSNYVASPKCTNHTTAKPGVLDSNVADSNAWQFPPPASRPVNGLLLSWPPCSGSGCEATSFVPNSAGCKYLVDNAGSEVGLDFSTFPANLGPVTNNPGNVTYPATTGYYSGAGNSVGSPTAVRYAAFNYAFNVAHAVRTDTTYNPVIYCVGLNFPTSTYPTEEPLDADFLATLANDPSYKSAGKPSGVYVNGQSSGKYYDVSYSGLSNALSNITTQILRLSAH